MKILIIEDDLDIAELLKYNFKEQDWGYQHVVRGSEGLVSAFNELPDIIILDLMLPDISGLDICRTLKSQSNTHLIPIIMLTAKSEEADRIIGFELGADDYVLKPFSPRELILRIKALSKRVAFKTRAESKQTNPTMTFGVLAIAPEKYEVKVQDKLVQLTALEFKILMFLFQMKGRVATRDKLLDRVWGYDAALTTRTVDTHIKRLREKLKEAGDYIETVRGVGYRFIENL